MKTLKQMVALMLAMVMLVLPVSANSNFTDSVVQKGVPTIVEMDDGKGNTAGAVVYDENGNIINSIPFEDIGVVTYADRINSSTKVANELRLAYYSIRSSSSLSRSMPALGNALIAAGSDLRPNDMVVCDLFYIDLSKEGKDILSDGESVGITFDLQVNQDDTIVVMRYVAPSNNMSSSVVNENGGKIGSIISGIFQSVGRVLNTIFGSKGNWEPVPSEDVIINEDGTVTVIFDKNSSNNVGTIAILTERTDA